MFGRSLDKLFLRFRDRHDGTALAAVFDATSRDLLEVAFHLARNPTDAEDLVQSTFLAAMLKADGYDGSAPVQGWLYGILWREAAKARRNAARTPDPRRLDVRSDPAPVEVAAHTELSLAVTSALERLPKRYREVLEPALLSSERPEEIALRLGRSSGSVRSQIHRGMRRLRRLLPAGTSALAAFGLSARGLPEIRKAVMSSAGFTSAAPPSLALGPALRIAVTSKAALVLAGVGAGALAVVVGSRAVDRLRGSGTGAQPAVLAQAPSARPRVADPEAEDSPEEVRSAASPRAPAAPESSAAGSASGADPVEYWLARFNEAPDDWSHGLRVATEMVKLPPDEALRILTAVWPHLSVPVKEQAIRPFVLERSLVHPLKILHLAATDPALSVQKRAFQYLTEYAFQDFSTDYEAYLRWSERFDGRPWKEVMTENAKDFIANHLTLSPPELRNRARSLERMSLDRWDAKAAGIDLASVLRDAGGLQLVETLLQDSDSKSQVLALVWSRWMQADERWLRTWVLPRVEHPDGLDRGALTASFRALGRPDCVWAEQPILEYLRREAETETPDAKHAAQALADIGDPAAIPGMIEVLLHDRARKLTYDVGYFGLAKLTGVTWQDTCDGPWWLSWWEKNRMRLPPGVRDATIAHGEGTNPR